MSEQFIIQYIPQRMKQLGYTAYHIRYRDILVEPLAVIVIPAYNELYFLIDEPDKTVIESDYGVYDTWVPLSNDNQHQHRGEIKLTNREFANMRVKFIQVIIVN